MLTVIVVKGYEERLALRKKALGGREAEELSLEGGAGRLLERAASAPLFSGKETYLLRSALAGDEAEQVMEGIEALVASEHLFLLEEEALPKPLREELKEAGAEILESEKGAAPSVRAFNTFALADALGKRDRKSLWMLMTRALRAGIPPEEIAGVLHWQARSMLASAQSGSAAEANMKDFVYSKSRRYAANFPGSELTELSRRLIILYHEGHRGQDLSLLLERFALSL